MEHGSGDTEHNSQARVTAIKYYDYTRRFYRLFWHGSTHALHYGYFDSAAKDLKSALIRMIEKTVENLKITQTDVVADLGCGIGGSAFWIAKEIGAEVHGITISSEQYKKAKRLQKKLDPNNKTHFKVGDFFHTEYKNESFDVALGIESLCYGQYAALSLAREMYRILKPDGRIAITDGFRGEGGLSEEQQTNIKTFERGFMLTKMIPPSEFIQTLQAAGFQDIHFHDWTENILPSADIMHKKMKQWHLVTVVLVRLGIVPSFMLDNNLTGQVQHELFHSRALLYGCITARK